VVCAPDTAFGVAGFIMAVPVTLAIKVYLETLHEEPAGRSEANSE